MKILGTDERLLSGYDFIGLALMIMTFGVYTIYFHVYRH